MPSEDSDQPGHLLGAQLVAKDPRFLHADSEDSDQTGRMPRLIFAGRTVILLVLSWGGSYITGFYILQLNFSFIVRDLNLFSSVKCNVGLNPFWYYPDLLKISIFSLTNDMEILSYSIPCAQVTKVGSNTVKLLNGWETYTASSVLQNILYIRPSLKISLFAVLLPVNFRIR